MVIKGGIMKQLIYFLVVGLTFTALQVAPVEAQEEYPDMEPPMSDGEPCDPATALEGDHRRLPAPEDMGKFFEYDQEYQTNGVLSQASYDELSEDGYTKKKS